MRVPLLVAIFAVLILAGILSDHFFVEVIWVPVWRPLDGKRGSVLEVCGSPANLELAEYVHAFVNHTGAHPGGRPPH